MELDNLPGTAHKLIVTNLDIHDQIILRLVSRLWKETVDLNTSKLRPMHIAKDFAARFPSLRSLDLRCVPNLNHHDIAVILELPRLLELRSNSSSFHCELHAAGNSAGLVSLEDLQHPFKITDSGREMSYMLDRLQGMLKTAKACQKGTDEASSRWSSLQSLTCYQASDSTNIQPLLEKTLLTMVTTGVGLVSFRRQSNIAAWRLKHLSLTDWHQDFTYFSGLTQLEKFTIGQLFGYNYMMPTITALNSLTRLTCLGLCGKALTSSDLGKLTALSGLLSLDVKESWLTAPFGVQTLVRTFPKLRNLDVSGCREFKMDSSLQALTALTSLEATRCQSLGSATLDSLTGMTQLRSLALSTDARSPVTAVDFFPLRRNYLGWSASGSWAEPAFNAGLTGLTYLNLPSMIKDYVTDTSMEHICCLSQLQCLKLEGASLSTAGVSKLSQLTCLTNLDLRRCIARERAMQFLEDIPLIYLYCNEPCALPEEQLSPRLLWAQYRADCQTRGKQASHRGERNPVIREINKFLP